MLIQARHGKRLLVNIKGILCCSKSSQILRVINNNISSTTKIWKIAFQISIQVYICIHILLYCCSMPWTTFLGSSIRLKIKNIDFTVTQYIFSFPNATVQTTWPSKLKCLWMSLCCALQWRRGSLIQWPLRNWGCFNTTTAEWAARRDVLMATPIRPGVRP